MKKKVTQDSIVEDKKNSTYGKAFTVGPALAIVKNKGITVQSLIALIKLKTEVTDYTKQYNEAVVQIMAKYEVEQGKNGHYEYGKHPKWKEIQEELKQLIDHPIEINSQRNFMTWAELQGATPDIDTETIAVLAEWLVKE